MSATHWWWWVLCPHGKRAFGDEARALRYMKHHEDDDGDCKPVLVGVK